MITDLSEHRDHLCSVLIQDSGAANEIMSWAAWKACEAFIRDACGAVKNGYSR